MSFSQTQFWAHQPVQVKVPVQFDIGKGGEKNAIIQIQKNMLDNAFLGFLWPTGVSGEKVLYKEFYLKIDTDVDLRANQRSMFMFL